MNYRFSKALTLWSPRHWICVGNLVVNPQCISVPVILTLKWSSSLKWRARYAINIRPPPWRTTSYRLTHQPVIIPFLCSGDHSLTLPSVWRSLLYRNIQLIHLQVSRIIHFHTFTISSLIVVLPDSFLVLSRTLLFLTFIFIFSTHLYL